MASVTVRNLDPDIKEALRRRAASHGRSMEEELRHLLAASVWEAGERSVAEKPVSAIDKSSDGNLSGRHMLLIIGGGIAAYKALDLIRRLRERGARVRTILTSAATEFITPLSVGALTAERVFTDLFDRNDEHDIGHIRLSRESDLVLVAPATADLMAKMASGLANDLASAVLLATDKPVLIAPAMNPRMWSHPATLRNRTVLEKDGIRSVGPGRGEMAESGESGEGRMAEPLEIIALCETILDRRKKSLAGRKIVMTSGPTHEPIDTVRYLANRSSGRQGHAIAGALARLGAEVFLVSGPVALPDPPGVQVVHVQTAEEMRDVVEQLLPADVAIMVAAVADWRPRDEVRGKIKKKAGHSPPALQLVENPDILAGIGHHEKRPKLVVGFAAETSDLLKNARSKLNRKGADLIVANDVSPEGGVMGGTRNTVRLVSRNGVEEWPVMNKEAVAERLADRVSAMLQELVI